MPMTKYYLKRHACAMLGFVLAILGYLALWMIANWKIGSVPERKEGQDTLDALATLHQKGSYQSEYFDFFYFESGKNPTLPVDIHAYFVDKTIYCFGPEHADWKKLCISYRSADGAPLEGSKGVIRNHQSLDLTHSVRLVCGENTFQVVPVHTELPILTLETMDHDLVYPLGGYVPAVGRLWTEDGEELLSQIFQVRVRGNTTSSMPKLPYKLKAEHPFELLGMQEAEEWTLLANFFDPSMLRNEIAFQIAKQLDMDFVPEQQYLELFLNGEYQGVYALTTQPGIHSGNINLPPLNKNGKGTYFIELDARSTGVPQSLNSLFQIPLLPKSPSVLSAEQRNMIQHEIHTFETALVAEDFHADGVYYGDLIDMRSFADAYLVHEFMGNPDASAPYSLFVYRMPDGRLAMGPVWDFDLAAGNNQNVEFTNPEGLHLNQSHWFGRMLQDPEFIRVVQQERKKLSGFEFSLQDFSKQYVQDMLPVSYNNFIITYIGVNDYSNVPQDNLFTEEVETLTEWLTKRFTWADANMDAALAGESE